MTGGVGGFCRREEKKTRKIQEGREDANAGQEMAGANQRRTRRHRCEKNARRQDATRAPHSTNSQSCHTVYTCPLACPSLPLGLFLPQPHHPHHHPIHPTPTPMITHPHPARTHAQPSPPRTPLAARSARCRGNPGSAKDPVFSPSPMPSPRPVRPFLAQFAQPSPSARPAHLILSDGCDGVVTRGDLAS